MLHKTSEGRETKPSCSSEPEETIPVFIASEITRQTPGKTKRMGAAAKKYNSKMTLLSIYKQRLGGFTSSGKQVLARGGAINGRFRFFFFFHRRRWAERRERAGLAREEQLGVGKEDGLHDMEGKMRRELLEAERRR